VNKKRTYVLSSNSTKKIVGKTVLVFSLLLIASLFTQCLGYYKRASCREYKRTVKAKKSYDAIIVPGIPYKGTQWSTLMKARVVWSWILYKNGIAKNVIYSGGAVHTPYQEARVMGLYAEQLGIPKENIYYDTCAQHSTENIYYSYLLAESKGFKNIAVASDVYQCFFLRRFIKRRFANKIAQIPANSDTLACYKNLDPIIDPSGAIIPDDEKFIPLTEKETYFQRMKGTFGMNINWKAQPLTLQ
jgi:uncharacterized SAM-binding protein YcdF (DUF218 family)